MCLNYAGRPLLACGKREGMIWTPPWGKFGMCALLRRARMAFTSTTAHGWLHWTNCCGCTGLIERWILFVSLAGAGWSWLALVCHEMSSSCELRAWLTEWVG